MTNIPEAEFEIPCLQGQPEIDDMSFEALSTNDKIERLIDSSLDALRLADLRSSRGRFELTSVLEKAEEMGYKRGFSEGVVEEQVQDTCNDIVGYMLAEIDNGVKNGSTHASFTEPVEEKDLTMKQQAMVRARKIFIDAEIPAQVDFYTDHDDNGETLFYLNLNLDLAALSPEFAQLSATET